METPQTARARGRAQLRSLTALAAGLSIVGVVGIAVATHSSGATANSSNNTNSSTNNNDDNSNNLQGPATNPENTQQQPQANSQGS